MALNFQQPNFPVPQYQGIANLGLTLDSIINAYQQAKRLKMQDDLQAQMRGQEQQRYGQQQARQDIMDTAALGFSPTQAAAGNTDAMRAVDEAIARKKEMMGAERTATMAEADLKTQQAALAKSKALKAGDLGEDYEMTGAEFNAAAGREVYPPDMKLSKSQVSIGRQKVGIESAPLTQETAKAKTLARDAISNLDDLERIIASPGARELILKAGGSMKGLLSLGDPQAESLANAIMQVGDAEARIKSGAALRAEEMDQYVYQLVPKAGTIEGIKDRIARKRRFFNNLISTTEEKKVAPKGKKEQAKDVSTMSNDELLKALGQ